MTGAAKQDGAPRTREQGSGRLKWILAAVAVVVALGLPALLLFGPNAAPTVSRQTTFITTPLAEDGLPNYALALMEQLREGVTPSNNGAVLFWQAIGPGDMDPRSFALICEELGIETAKSDSYLVGPGTESFREQLRSWIKSERQAAGANENSAAAPAIDAELSETAIVDIDGEIDAILEEALASPWTATDCPPLAQWAAANEAPLNLLVEAAARPRFYTPPPNVLDDPNTALYSILLPQAQEFRAAARSLATRATYRIGSKQYADAWQDCLACWRLGGHAAAGHTIVERLVGMAIRGVSRDCTLALLERDDLPEDISQQVLDDLAILPPSVTMADAVNAGERYMFLDYTLRLLTGRLGGADDGIDEGLEKSSQVFAFDVDEPLRIGNEWYDRIVSMMEMEDIPARREAMRKLDDGIQQMASELKSKMLGGLVSRSRRSELMGRALVALFLPAVGAAVDAEDRDRTNLALTRMAAALAVHRARTGEYPESLSELAPGVLPSMILDPYSNMPLIYARRDEGYVLYSVFQNGVDDGGQDWSGEIVDGEWAAETRQIDMGQSDLVVRVPRTRRQKSIDASTR